MASIEFGDGVTPIRRKGRDPVMNARKARNLRTVGHSSHD